MTIIEIEDNNGNSIMSFRINGIKEEDIIKDIKGGEIADCESDYIYNTNEPLIRLQCIKATSGTSDSITSDKYRIVYNDDTFKFEINKVPINVNVFDNELSEYEIRHREDVINNLIGWIDETNSENDKALMLDDLKMLLNIKDEFILSSISTNEYLSPELDIEGFNSECENIIKLSKKEDEKNDKKD